MFSTLQKKSKGEAIRAVLFKPEEGELVEISIFNDATLAGVFFTSEKNPFKKDGDVDEGINAYMSHRMEIQENLCCITGVGKLPEQFWVTKVKNKDGKIFAMTERIIFSGTVVDGKYTPLELSVDDIGNMIVSSEFA
jgi:hypothetical protein